GPGRAGAAAAVRVKRLAVLAVVLGALAAPALARAAAPPIARPDPVLYPVRLDYTNPLPGPNGTAATLAPLEQGVIMASVRDEADLAYARDDLGGFGQARIGVFPLTSGGRDVLLPGKHATQIPLFKVAGGGTISSFTFTSPPTRPTPPPDNGSGPGITPPPPPSPGENVPPANQGFGGTPGGGSSGGGSTTTTTGGGGTTTRKLLPPTTTTAPPVTTAPSTTTIAASRGGGGSGGGGGSACSGGSCSPGACGTPGISITSTIPNCTIVFGNSAPGDSTSEILTITNTSGSPYTLSLRASGSHNSSLWRNGPDGLLMGVWDVSGPAPGSFPTLFSWTTGYWPLTTLNPGQTVQYEIELFLPITAGNADQNRTAVIDFDWTAS
ncbi:MAG TPA: hypothetical protein VMU58_08480, partial [Gaiellaceae bacterium]|nr:hypothetical protein [Gaiellaceae bacterium]